MDKDRSNTSPIIRHTFFNTWFRKKKTILVISHDSDLFQDAELTIKCGLLGPFFISVSAQTAPAGNTPNVDDNAFFLYPA